MKKRLLKILLLALCYSPLLWRGAGGEALAQHPEAKRATHWYFGNGAGLDFSSGNPVAVTNGALHSIEGCATMSDTSGNLLFYTDGDTVWDRTHNAMPNGTGLSSNICGNIFQNSSMQGALIVPHPGNTNQYYLFTTGCGENFGNDGFRYSLIDMSLNSGLGNVVNSEKNILLFAPCVEAQSATLHANGVDFWVVAHEYNNSNFRIYKIDSFGLNITPQIIPTGLIVDDYFASIKFSPDGTRLALMFQNFLFPPFNGLNEILYFDNTNGVLTHKINLPSQAVWGSFSPDNSKFYITDSGNSLFVYDLCENDSISIIESIDTLTYGVLNSSDLAGLQIGLDLKIYSSCFCDSISVISNPNKGSGFNAKSISLNGKLGANGTPNFIDYYFNQTNPCSDTIIDKIILTELIVPNIFTPNNDGINDVFSIEINGYENIAWKIYNRWGQSVKSGKLKVESDGAVELWDGRTHPGTKARDGTYYYIINLTKKGGNHETKKGFVQILN
ncbi:MAG: gliding motility-associated C-terminal domain-containing protein [Vicingaceae bacterium]|nr:gliding motility-associated C-terminal domain-containing protein [Vicingaceae bacterium]